MPSRHNQRVLLANTDMIGGQQINESSYIKYMGVFHTPIFQVPNPEKNFPFCPSFSTLCLTECRSMPWSMSRWYYFGTETYLITQCFDAVWQDQSNTTDQSQYNQMATNKVQLRLTSLSHFFHQPTPAQLRSFDHSEKLLQAFFSETPQPKFQRKIILTDQYMVISDKTSDGFEPALVLELSQSITFQKFQHQHESKTKTQGASGFALIKDGQQCVRIYFQFRSLSELWMGRLCCHLNQLGFHDQYKLLDRIGKGSTSTVYKVQRLTDGKIFAAKVFLKSFLESKPQRKSSVFNEITLLRAIEHQNILKIIEVFESASAVYIITELLEGGTLFERINQLKGFKLPDVKRIMKGIIQGLSYMHRYGIMHRDIKLENIMLRSKGSLDVVIVDFGLAAMSDDQPYIFYRCGTPGYIAPEIIGMTSNEKIDPICDIFSAGVILHVLLTNRYLFEGKDNQQVYMKNKGLQFDLQDARYKPLDMEAMDLLYQMLELDPEERYNAEDILSHEFLDEAESEPSEKELVSPATTYGGAEQFVL